MVPGEPPAARRCPSKTMNLAQLQHDHAYCLERAAEVLETQQWEWEAAWSAYCESHGGGKPVQQIGFNSPAARNRKNVDAPVTQHSA